MLYFQGLKNIVGKPFAMCVEENTIEIMKIKILKYCTQNIDSFTIFIYYKINNNFQYFTPNMHKSNIV